MLWLCFLEKKNKSVEIQGEQRGLASMSKQAWSRLCTQRNQKPQAHQLRKQMSKGCTYGYIKS